MTDYTDWKILKTELDEKSEEYSAVAEWCNEGQEYHIEEQGEYYAVVPNPVPPPPTEEEQREARARAYQEEVDPITSHIQRLRDEETPDEEKIAQLIQERADKVIEIQERFPYPDEESV